MDWFRHYHGLASDPKLSLVAEIAGVHHCVAVAAWCAILEHASCAEERGSVEHLDAAELALTIRVSRDEAERLLAAFRTRRHITGDSVRQWTQRQFASDSSTERVRRHRERQRLETQGETLQKRERNVSETDQIRSEQIRTDIQEAPAGGDYGKSAEAAQAPAGAGSYRFRGDVIRLNERHFEGWRASFHGIDLLANLTDLDAWLSGLPPNSRERKSWFQVVSGALRKRHEVAMAAKKSAAADYRLDPKRADLPG